MLYHNLNKEQRLNLEARARAAQADNEMLVVQPARDVRCVGYRPWEPRIPFFKMPIEKSAVISELKGETHLVRCVACNRLLHDSVFGLGGKCYSCGRA